MSSEKQAAASRRNGCASQGPRTAAGKAKSSRNALRHGLNVPVIADPKASSEAQALATRISGHGAGPLLQALALRVAEVQIDLCRVRQARHRLLSRKSEAQMDDRRTGEPAIDGPARLVLVLKECGQEFVTLDRYERRALSRRNSAVRAFDVARAKDVLAKRTRAARAASALAERTWQPDRNGGC